jgi:cephalosporin-C deacetylase
VTDAGDGGATDPVMAAGAADIPMPITIRPPVDTLSMPRFNHGLPFDPTYGYDVPALLEVPAPDEPPDFVAFWQATYRQARSIALRLEARRVDSPWPGVEVHHVAYDSWDGIRIGAYLSVPADRAAIERGVVIGHGYGGRDQIDWHRHHHRQVAIYPCARGLGRSRHESLPDNAAWHVIHGIDDRATYLHRGCVADYWLAASALVKLFPQVVDRLHYEGGCFGGGIGALMLPWDRRFKAAALAVPSFGNHPLRVTLRCNGSGAAVQARHLRSPQVLDVLAYYDAAVAAAHLRVPVAYACAMFDPAVPPPGQFAVFNATPAPKSLYIRRAGHFDDPDAAADDQQIARMQDELFDAH